MPRNKKNQQARKKEDMTEAFLARRAELLELSKDKFPNTPEWYVVLCVENYLKTEFPDYVYDPPLKEDVVRVSGVEVEGVEVDSPKEPVSM